MARLRLALAAAIVSAAAAFGTSAHASGTDLPDQSASASGTGGASTARTGDPAAAYFNPAALVDGQGLRVGLGASLALASLQAKSSDGAPPPAFDTTSEAALRVIPYLGASYSHQWFMGGLSVHVPFGGGVSWPKDWPLRFEAISTSARVFRIAPFVGARWGAVAIAAGPQIDLASLEVQRATNHVLEEGQARLALSGAAVSAQAALFVEASKELTFGFSYKSASVIPLQGDADFKVPPTFAPQYPDQSVSARLKLPHRFAIGTSWAIVPPLRLLADVTLTTWSINDALVFDFDKPQTPDSTIRNEWSNTVAVRVGGEYAFTPAFTGRAGFFVDGINEPAAPSRNLSPTSPDMSRVGPSLGAGLQLAEGVSLDAFYSLTVLIGRSGTSADYPLATYGGSAHVFGVGARFALPPAK